MKHGLETTDRLAAYRSLLLRWNARINLISGETATEIDQRHIADCAQLGPLLPGEGAVADIGSGAGLPGMVLAIFLDQKIRAEGWLRTIYLYPMALSFIVTGTAWKWILNPSDGLQRVQFS